jgi:hypothetical protein
LNIFHSCLKFDVFYTHSLHCTREKKQNFEYFYPLSDNALWNISYFLIIWFDMNTAIRLADPTGEKIVILDNLCWYCDITNNNIFILLQIQIVPWNNRSWNRGTIEFCCKN